MSSTLADHVPGGSNTLADELNFPERPTSAGGCRLTESGPFKSLTHLFPFSLSFGPLHSFSSTTLLFSSLLGYRALKYAADYEVVPNAVYGEHPAVHAVANWFPR